MANTRYLHKIFTYLGYGNQKNEAKAMYRIRKMFCRNFKSVQKEHKLQWWNSQIKGDRVAKLANRPKRRKAKPFTHR